LQTNSFLYEYCKKGQKYVFAYGNEKENVLNIFFWTIEKEL